MLENRPLILAISVCTAYKNAWQGHPAPLPDFRDPSAILIDVNYCSTINIVVRR